MPATTVLDSPLTSVPFADLDVVETVDLPGRDARYAPVPARLDPRVGAVLTKEFANGLYSHQAEAITRFLAGDDVCLATSTASGKSLAFMTCALDTLLRDRFSRVLALYPAKALIQDQLAKWEDTLRPFGIDHTFIDGSVPVARREELLQRARVVLMTPDVVHAWLLAKVGQPVVNQFLARLRLLVLDEAHVYDGVFGTNMAFLLRRLTALAGPHRLFTSTATIGEPERFLGLLTGRDITVIGPEQDGSISPAKSVVLLRPTDNDAFEATVDLLRDLSRDGGRKFLAFGDSRKMVERIVAATLRGKKTAVVDPEPEDEGEAEADDDGATLPRVLPYRAGYEAQDRVAIQKALTNGGLAGVVSTSALEMGIDIGDIDIVVLLNAPTSSRSLWQRLGRAGRRRTSVCLVVDDERRVLSLKDLLDRPVERGWLYLDNRYIQYANALATSQEMTAAAPSPGDEVAFASLPPSFVRMVANDMNPAEQLPDDLYALKQRTTGDPHHEFPLRSAAEKEFRVTDLRGLPLGTLSLPQALREAYPGAIHYYMAKPYRVVTFDHNRGEIKVKRARHYTTQAISLATVFPRFGAGTRQARVSDGGLLVETDLQVSERVEGFVERRGGARFEHRYGPESLYYRRPITRFFQTTGVCWFFDDTECNSQALAALVLEAFCVTCGIQSRDLGVGTFRTTSNPLLPAARAGACIYDATHGSLRLTEQLAARFEEVLTTAIALAQERDDWSVVSQLRALASAARDLAPVTTTPGSTQVVENAATDWVHVIAPGERAMYLSGDGPLDVTVKGVRYTPQGLLYELESPKPGRWMVVQSSVQPLNGETRLVRFNLTTGEMEQ
jgi:DEAD/DEAH box helicase domain-containing protein